MIFSVFYLLNFFSLEFWKGIVAGIKRKLICRKVYCGVIKSIGLLQVNRFFANLDLALRRTLSTSEDNRRKCEELEKARAEVNISCRAFYGPAVASFFVSLCRS